MPGAATHKSAARRSVDVFFCTQFALKGDLVELVGWRGPRTACSLIEKISVRT